MSDVYIQVERPDDYDDVHSQLVAEDFTIGIQPGWTWCDATDEIARLTEENENLKNYIRDRLPADHIAALLKEIVTGVRSALDGEP